MRTGPHGARAAAGAWPGQGTLFPWRERDAPVPSQAWQQRGQGGEPGAKNHPELPGARAQDLNQRLPVGPLPLSPGLRRWASWSSLLLLTAFFCQLWPEGTLGSQTMTSALSHPGASQHLPQCGLREKYKPAEALLVADSAANTALWFMRKTHTEMR